MVNATGREVLATVGTAVEAAETAVDEAVAIACMLANVACRCGESCCFGLSRH